MGAAITKACNCKCAQEEDEDEINRENNDAKNPDSVSGHGICRFFRQADSRCAPGKDDRHSFPGIQKDPEADRG